MAKKAKLNQGIKIIKKANTLIEARYRFDVWETRMFLSMLASIRMEDVDFQPYRIWFKDVIKIFGLKSHQSYDLLRDAAKSLMKKTFHVNYMDNGYVREKAYHIIRTTDYLKEGQTGSNIDSQEYIDITIDPEMKPLLLQLKNNFTAYDLRNVAKLGAQPVRLYELLKQFESIGSRTLEIEYMKRILELDTEYKNVFDFYRYFIIPALKEINKNTDIEVYNHEKIKDGKRVVALNFFFRRKTDQELEEMRGNLSAKNKKMKVMADNDTLQDIAMAQDPTPSAESMATDSDRLFTELYPKVVENLGVTPSVFIEILRTYSAEQIQQAIRVTNRAKMNDQIKTNVAGFFIQALKEGYSDPKEEKIKKEKKDVLTKRLESQKVALESEKQEKIYDRIRELTATNPSLTLNAIETLKLTELGKKLIQTEEKKLKRTLDVEDFRQIKELRVLVIDTLFVKNIESFTDIIKEYDAKIAALDKTTIF